MQTQLDQLAKHNPVMGIFCSNWHDDCVDIRPRLAPCVTKFLHSPSSPATEQTQALLITDWYLRISTPVWLELSGFGKEAANLRAYPAITKWADLAGIQPLLDDAKEKTGAAHDAAYRAAFNAAYRAAYRAAFGAAHRAAYRAAHDAAFDAAYGAAFDAAFDAAYRAASGVAKEKLDATVSFLQDSAFALLGRCVIQDPFDILKDML